MRTKCSALEPLTIETISPRLLQRVTTHRPHRILYLVNNEAATPMVTEAASSCSTVTDEKSRALMTSTRVLTMEVQFRHDQVRTSPPSMVRVRLDTVEFVHTNVTSFS